MGSNPSRFSGCAPECPVESVSWDDVQQFIAKLNHKTGQKYRLPSEAEWEYAARAGTTTHWSFGNDESKLGNYAWYSANSARQTQEVGQKLPNAFGIFDMHGNVWEWVQDCWHEDYAGAPVDGSAWTTDCSGNYRVLRGGSSYGNPANLRSAYRNRLYPVDWNDYFGFRLARTFTDTQTPPVIKQAESENVEKSAYYTVRPGDTLVRIGLDNGQNYRDIARWNGLEQPLTLEVGQVLRILPPEK